MKFVKMQSCGNDYVYFEQGNLNGAELSALAVKMSDRHKGIGSDGIISVNRRGDGIAMRIFNADGTEGKTCGNGVRCAAAFAGKYLGVKANPMTVYTRSGVRRVAVDGKNMTATAAMGTPSLILSSAYFCEKLQLTDLYVNERDVFAVSVGNPHAVYFSGLPLDIAVKHTLSSGLFKDGVNVECAALKDGGLAVEVYERGSGKTLACGSGAVAAVFAAVLSGRLPEGKFVTVFMPGGQLKVKIDGKEAYLSGETAEVFGGEYEI